MIEAEKGLFDSMQESGFTSEGIMDLYGFNKASEKLWKEAEGILAFIVANTGSLSIIAGAILQIAKQGISFKYKSLTQVSHPKAGTQPRIACSKALK